MEPPPLVHGQIGELFWSTHDAVAILSEGRVIAWNPAAERIFGVPAEVATAPDFDLSLLLGLSPSRIGALAGAPPGTIEPPAGPVLQVSSWRLQGRGETVLLFTDISGVHRTERGLRELNAFAGTLLNSAGQHVDELLRMVAARAKSLIGADHTAVMLVKGRAMTVIRHAFDAPPGDIPDRLPIISPTLRTELAAGGSLRVDDVRSISLGQDIGADYPAIGPFMVVPLRAGNETIGAVFASSLPGARPFDATDESLLAGLAGHAAAAVAAAAASAEAEETAERRREAIAAARHDIANPLAAGRGYVQILQRRYDDMTPEQRTRALAALAASFERLEEYSHRLLFDERLEISGPPMHWEEVSLDPFLDSAAHDLETSLAVRRIRVSAARVERCPPTLAADPSLLREVVDNLLSNAAKFTPDDGEIQLIARPDEDAVRIEVIDTGVGIPLDEQRTLFERHTRTRQSRRDAVPGMGLGLSIVRRIVEAHGGMSGVRSRPGVGTAMWVTFPVRRPTAEGPGDVRQAESQAERQVGSA